MTRAVAITCDCGASGTAPVGARVECECGRVFMADGPPEQHRAAAESLLRRHRLLLGLSLGLVVLACLATLLVLDRAAALVVPVAAVVLWFATVRPHLRRRHRRALAALPGWDLP